MHAMSQQFIYSVLKNETRIPRQDQLLLWMGAAAKWTKFPTILIGYILVSGQPKAMNQLFHGSTIWKLYRTIEEGIL